ncbi:MAG: response regulator, partial [Zetaproteobacteria bacterium]|nr:response regulator [Zetaproteobacteria bacterium]
MGQKVLIVDDADDLRFSIEVILRMNGYETFSARNGKEALDQVVSSQISGERFDLIITDIVMPEMSGIELME